MSAAGGHGPPPPGGERPATLPPLWQRLFRGSRGRRFCSRLTLIVLLVLFLCLLFPKEAIDFPTTVSATLAFGSSFASVPSMLESGSPDHAQETQSPTQSPTQCASGELQARASR